jgi:O-antigen/teichoic acid export membrane protein
MQESLRCSSPAEARCDWAVPPLRVNFTWTLSGNMVYTASQGGMLVVLARLGSPEAVGQFSLGLAIAAPIFLLAGLQLRAVQATDARFQFHFGDHAALRLVTTCAAVLLLFTIAAAEYRGEMALTVVAFALSKGIESFSDIVYGFWQQRERMDLVARSLMLRGVLSLAALTACFAVLHSICIAVFGIAAAWGAVFVAFDIPQALRVAGGQRRALLPRFSKPTMVKLLRTSFPLGIALMLVSFNANVPRYMISSMRGMRELGIFSTLSYPLVAGTTIVNALGQSASPRLARYHSAGRHSEFYRLSSQLVMIGVALGLSGVSLALISGRQILAILYGPEYAEHGVLFAYLMIAAGVGYLGSFSGYSLIAASRFRVQVPLCVAISVITVASCAFFVKSDGATGAAWALAIAALVQFAASQVLLRQRDMATGEVL